MLNKYSYLFSLFLIFTLSLEAKSLLYKMSSNDSTIYILGSIHLAKPELYPLDKEITKAYKESEVLVVELDPSSVESMNTIQQVIISAGRYPSGKSLKTELSAKTYRALEEYTKKVGMPISSMQSMKPWVVMLQLTVTEMIRLGYFPDLGVDRYFLDLAKSEHKNVISLETAQEQMSLVAKDDKHFQDKLLLYTLESMHEMEPMLDEMFMYWKNGDAAAFDKIMSMPLETDPSLNEIYDDLIIQRNYRMTQKIEGLLRTKKTYFVVVGSGHVVGEEGIISLLKQKGYKLTQK